MNDDSIDPQPSLDDTGPEKEPRFRWEVVVVLGFIIMGLLSMSLWRRVQQVDPVQRCQDAYMSSYTPIDTTLVDRIKVRNPFGGPRTTCGVLRLNGSVDSLPHRSVRGRTMP